jgi:3'-5' exoribonuclease
MGAEWVSGECTRIEGFPPDKAMLVKHMILSHHGELEFGSPKRPKTLEAILLHFVENMDSKANAFHDAMEDLREGATWTDYRRMFERYLYAGKKRK